MLFFSTILGAKVIDSADEVVGKVTDVLIKTDKERKYPPLIGAIIKHKKKELFIPAEIIESWGPGEMELDRKINGDSKEIPSGKNIVSLRHSVLDKQIVDLAGMRVVRVNDLQIGRVQQTMSLIAIDVSTRGLLRRLGLSSPSLNKIWRPHLIEWKNISPLDNKIHLHTGANDLLKLHPADIANIIERMNVNQSSTLLESMDKATAARVLEEVQPSIKKILVKSLGAGRAAGLMGKMSVDELVDIMQLLPKYESHEILKKLPTTSERASVKKLMEYDEDTAGGLMTTEFISVYPSTTVEEVIEKIKSTLHHPRHASLFVYVIDRQGKFKGVVPLKKLIVASKSQEMQEIMSQKRKARTVRANYDLLSVATLMTKYNLLSVAVLDDEKRILGIITVDDVMREFVPNA
jgi:CBS domain-containing protein